MHQNDHVEIVAAEPFQQGCFIDSIDSENRRYGIAEEVFAPREVGPNVGVGTSTIFIAAQDQPRATIPHRVYFLEHMRHIVVEMCGDPMGSGVSMLKPVVTTAYVLKLRGKTSVRFGLPKHNSP